MEPQPLKGFNDWFAPDVKLREYVINILKTTFEKYGYEPLETPALEYTEFMLGVSGEEAEKQFYRFKDQGGRDVMLKYEVMTSMCRAIASNLDKITLPYKRYQIQPVWRAENTQKGRYREFTQADADTIGSPSMIADAEFIQMGLEICQKLGFQDFVARISNRKFLEGLREFLAIPPENFYGMCMSIDKLKKIGSAEVLEELISKRGLEKEKAEKIMEIVTNSTLDSVSETIGKTKIGAEAISELKQIFEYLQTAGVDQKLYSFDPSIARGLASYTGPVWELEIVDGGVGSIAGCGRYDNLLGKYLGGNKGYFAFDSCGIHPRAEARGILPLQNKSIPATGGSFGIERICDIIKDRQMLDLGKTNTKVLVTIFSPELLNDSLRISSYLRNLNINSLLYPSADTKLDKQIKYALDKEIPFLIIIGPDEISQGKITLKNLDTREQKTVLLNQIAPLLSL